MIAGWLSEGAALYALHRLEHNFLGGVQEVVHLVFAICGKTPVHGPEHSSLPNRDPRLNRGPILKQLFPREVIQGYSMPPLTRKMPTCSHKEGSECYRAL